MVIQGHLYIGYFRSKLSNIVDIVDFHGGFVVGLRYPESWLNWTKLSVTVCLSDPQTQLSCYVRVLRESCNTSAVNINMLKAIFYNARLWNVGRASWEGSTTLTLSESYTVHHKYSDCELFCLCGRNGHSLQSVFTIRHYDFQTTLRKKTWCNFF